MYQLKCIIYTIFIKLLCINQANSLWGHSTLWPKCTIIKFNWYYRINEKIKILFTFLRFDLDIYYDGCFDFNALIKIIKIKIRNLEFIRVCATKTRLKLDQKQAICKFVNLQQCVNKPSKQSQNPLWTTFYLIYNYR